MAETIAGAEPLTYSGTRGRWVVAATILGSGIVSLDGSVVSIALPPIARTFHTGITTLQWVVTGYTLTLAAFLLLGGSLGDRFGRRRVFMLGVVWFTIASVACGLAPNAVALVAARLLQGIGGALLVPASLAILEASFMEQDRARAIGAWSGFTGVAVAAGPLVGGWLIAISSWRLVFAINVPLAMILLPITARHVPESRNPGAARSLDIWGSVAAVAFLAGLTTALIEGPAIGWASPRVVVAIVVALAAGPLFILIERRGKSPLVPLELFANRQFSAANGVTFLVYGALGGTFFLLPVALQLVDGYSPLDSGIATLPVTVMMFLFSARSGALAARIGPRLQMSVGPVVVGVGLALLHFVATGAGYVTHVLPAVLVFGFGLALTVAPLTTTALGAAAPEHAGVASAVNNVVSRAAGLLAVAVLPVIGGISGRGALSPDRFSHGFEIAIWCTSAVCILGGLVAWRTITNGRRGDRRTDEVGPAV